MNIDYVNGRQRKYFYGLGDTILTARTVSNGQIETVRNGEHVCRISKIVIVFVIYKTFVHTGMFLWHFVRFD